MVLLRLHSSSNQWAAHEICCAFTLTEETPILVLDGKILHIDAKIEIQSYVSFAWVGWNIIFKMAEKKTSLVIISTVKQKQCSGEVVTAVLDKCKAMQVV